MSQSQLGRAQFEPYFPHLEKFLQWPRVAFLEPYSTRSQPFTQWNRQPYSFFTDDFCHQKSFTAKLTAKTLRSTIKIKQTVSQKKSGAQLADEVKLWFDLPNHGAFYAKVKSTDYIKVMYDHGVRAYRGNYYYVFGGVNSNKLLQSVNVRLGLGFLTNNGQCQNRLKANLEKDTQYYWYHKSFLAHRDFRFGFLSVVNLNHFIFQKNNLLLGYHFNSNTCAYLRTEVKDFRSVNPDIRKPDTYFDHVTADVIHRINSNSKAGVQATFSIRQRLLSEAKVVYQYDYTAKKILKASLSNKLNLAIVVKTPLYGLEDIGTLSVGLGVEQLSSKNASFKTGLEVNLNL